jgi:Protein of unknown function (DUF2894)
VNLPGAQLPEPLRRAYIEALARRAAAHDGAVRAWLEQRLVEAGVSSSRSLPMAAAGLDGVPTRASTPTSSSPSPLASPSTSTSTSTSTPGARRRPGPLAELTARLDRSAVAGGPGAVLAASSGPVASGPPELKSLQRDRATWARLSVDQELQRALAQVPDNPGPLNSHLLVLRSLRLMQTLSPDYLARFVSQLETLVWLDQASFGSVPVRAPAVRREPAAKRPRTRGGKAVSPGG